MNNPSGFKRLFAECAAKCREQLSHYFSAQYDNFTVYSQPSVCHIVISKKAVYEPLGQILHFL